MFTGIIEEIGEVKNQTRDTFTHKLTINCKKILEDSKKGDSIAVNGVCLTIVKLGAHWFTADVSPETIKKTSLNFFNPGEKVNLERALLANGRFGGHIVSGHVDDLGEIISRQQTGNSTVFTIRIPDSLKKYCINRGSITLDGISLTIANLEDNLIKLSIIPETLKQTNLQFRKTGDKINIETDIIGKYIEKLFNPENINNKKSKIDHQFLIDKGFLT